MSHTQPPKDIVDSYAWMKRMVIGLETQTIKTVRGSDYGIKEHIPIPIRAGWEFGPRTKETESQTQYSKPYARMVADHTTIFGAIRWHSGEDERALVIPPELRPFETYTFIVYNELREPVHVRITPSGFLYAPTGSGSSINLTCRYASARDGG